MILDANRNDYVIINSLPSVNTGRGKGSGDDAVNNWIYMLNKIIVPVILIQHDHTIYSIKRNAALNEVITRSNIIFVHSTTNDFSDVVIQNMNNLDRFFDETKSKQLLGFQPGINFDNIRKKYWKSVEEQNFEHHKWIGRCTSWKGHDLMFQWHDNYLKMLNHVTTLEGIEKSPAFLGFKEMYDFDNRISIDPDLENANDFKGQKGVVYGPFNNDKLLERMSKTGFGYQLSILKPKYLDRSIEYTHCEIVACGTIPVFRKEYGDNCKHRLTGNKLSSDKNTGTIWLGKDNMNDCIDIVKRLQDPIMRDEWREMAFEYYSTHQDSQYTFTELHNNIEFYI